MSVQIRNCKQIIDNQKISQKRRNELIDLEVEEIQAELEQETYLITQKREEMLEEQKELERLNQQYKAIMDEIEDYENDINTVSVLVQNVEQKCSIIENQMYCLKFPDGINTSSMNKGRRTEDVRLNYVPKLDINRVDPSTQANADETNDENSFNYYSKNYTIISSMVQEDQQPQLGLPRASVRVPSMLEHPRQTATCSN